MKQLAKKCIGNSKGKQTSLKKNLIFSLLNET